MKRVILIGSPGTGKSHFAKKLALKTLLPLHHLDFYYHEPSKDYKQNKEAWKNKVKELENGPKWIIDGNYASTMKERMSKADTIIFFDLPTFVAMRGIISRIFERNRTDIPKGWQGSIDWSFIKYVWTFRSTYRQGTLKLLKAYSTKDIVIFKKRKDAEKYLQTLI